MKRITYIFTLVALGSLLMAGLARAGSSSQQLAHDVAVTDIQGPAEPVLQGDIVTVNVTVANLGAVEETITLVLHDDTDARDVEIVLVTLPPGASLTIGMQWNTERASGGEHTLTATASVADDADPGNNSRSNEAPVTVLPTEISFPEAPDAVFEQSVLQPNIDTMIVGKQSFFVGNSDASFGRAALQPDIDTVIVEKQSFFVGNSDASFGRDALQPDIDTTVVEKQSFFVGNADAIFQSRTTFRRPLPPDLNCDGATNIFDAVVLLRYMVGLISVLECQGIPLFVE